MALTSKDLEIINQALAQYEATLEDGYDEEMGRPNNPAYDYHKKHFGNPVKTVEATRQRVFKEINKRERTCV
jgi:hypothetical protein